jgi:DeoR family transcriptional regulator, glycerol-3-phosphate regulon repressor
MGAGIMRPRSQYRRPSAGGPNRPERRHYSTGSERDQSSGPAASPAVDQISGFHNEFVRANIARETNLARRPTRPGEGAMNEERPAMSAMSPRQAEILQLAKSAGRVAVEDLARRFDVTPQTVRKDLNELCERRVLQRVHGGAVVASGVANLSYEARRFAAAGAKRAIGGAAAGLIPDGSSLFINIGTTTEEVAKALALRDDLLVITNNLNVAQELHRHPGIEVIITGGTVRKSDGAVVGTAATSLIRQFKVDFAVIGVSAIDVDGTLLDFDYREVLVTQAIIENARQVVLVTDQSKFTRKAPVRIGHLSQIDSFVTDHLPSEDIRQLCAEARVEVIETDPAGVSEVPDFD